MKIEFSSLVKLEGFKASYALREQKSFEQSEMKQCRKPKEPQTPHCSNRF